jgi:UDP-N-acetylmuramoyl-tripeptide--D-alanyl-D-alanine ligase
MVSFTLKQIAQITGGQMINCDPSQSVRYISTDSRTLKPGQAFLALKGQNYNAHNFIPQAIAAGAPAVIISQDSALEDYPAIKVADTLTALGDLAASYRSRFSLDVVGIAGANGKTTTKLFINQLLQDKFNTYYSPASFNNFIGVPLTLLSLTSEVRLLIQEMETNAIGGIKRLCNMAKPNIGLVTNISPIHLKTLGDSEGVFQERAELLQSLPSSGTAVINADDTYSQRLQQSSAASNIISFGIKQQADYRGYDIEFDDPFFNFRVNGVEFRLKTPFYKNIYNFLSALAVANAIFKLDLTDLANKTDDLSFPPLRGELIEINQIKVIADCYNANPQSTKDALLTMNYFNSGKKIAFLADMQELGGQSNKLHRQLGEFCVQADLDCLICFGPKSSLIAQALEDNPASTSQVKHFDNFTMACDFLMGLLQPGDVLLLKGSRAMRLERVIKRIKQD